jgi:hypothetical protein
MEITTNTIYNVVQFCTLWNETTAWNEGLIIVPRGDVLEAGRKSYMQRNYLLCVWFSLFSTRFPLQLCLIPYSQRNAGEQVRCGIATHWYQQTSIPK